MKRLFILHPVLFAVYPIFFILAYNVEQLYLADDFFLSYILIPIIISLCMAFALWLLLFLIIKDARKAGLITSFFLMQFFSYGHLHNIVDQKMGTFVFEAGNLIIGPHKIVFSLFFLSTIIVFYFTVRAKRGLYALTKGLNLAGIILVCVTLFGILTGGIVGGVPADDAAKTVSPAAAHATKAGAVKKMPDIYYIILDAYAGSNVLREVYGYDNSGFEEYLREKGFYIARDSRSNYTTTTLSLASSLNMDYVDFGADADRGSVLNRPASIVYRMHMNNKVMRGLKDMGYKIVYLASSYGFTQHCKYADIEYHCGSWLNEFYIMLIKTTMLVRFKRYFLVENDRKAVQDAFCLLSEAPAIKGPKFVFAHIVKPHPPYLFDREGNIPEGETVVEMYGGVWGQRDKYIDQLIFINKKVMSMVDDILRNSASEPIIIIQADHGTASTAVCDLINEQPRLWEGLSGAKSMLISKKLDSIYRDPTYAILDERTSILNAYHLPGRADELIYDKITPVNTFRVIFKHYFNLDYELIEDKTYYSPPQDPYNFSDVTDRLQTRW